jgi:hypothetical protein
MILGIDVDDVGFDDVVGNGGIFEDIEGVFVRGYGEGVRGFCGPLMILREVDDDSVMESVCGDGVRVVLRGIHGGYRKKVL